MRTKRISAILLAWGLTLTQALSVSGVTVCAAAPEAGVTAEAPETAEGFTPVDDPAAPEDPAGQMLGEEAPAGPGEEEDASGEAPDPDAEEMPVGDTDPEEDDNAAEQPTLPEELTAEDAADAGLFAETSDTPERTGEGNPLELECDEDIEWLDGGNYRWIKLAEFDPAIVGYTAAQRPKAKEVTVKNTGTEPLTLESPAVTNAALSDQWEISGLKESLLGPGEETTFTLRPRTGIIARWDGNEWQNTRFDICVKTADGGTEAHIPAVFRVGLVGTELGAYLWGADDSVIDTISRVYTARDLARYYGEDDVALLVGDTDIQLAPGDNLKIGGFKQDDGWATLSIGGTTAPERGKIKAGTLQAGILQAAAIDITDGVVWADEIFVDGAANTAECYFNLAGGELHVTDRFRVKPSECTFGSVTEMHDPETDTWFYEVYNTAKAYIECPMDVRNLDVHAGSKLHVTPGDHEAEGAILCHSAYIRGDLYVRDAVNENRTTPARAISCQYFNQYAGHVVVEEPCPAPGSVGIFARDNMELHGNVAYYGAGSEEDMETPTLVAFSQAGPAIQCACAEDSYYFPAGIRLYDTSRVLAQSGSAWQEATRRS